MRRIGIIALLLVIAAVVIKECVTPGTLGFDLFRSRPVFDATCTAVIILLYLLSRDTNPRRSHTDRKPRSDPASEFVDAEVVPPEETLRPDSPDAEILSPAKEEKRPNDPRRLHD